MLNGTDIDTRKYRETTRETTTQTVYITPAKVI